jgi:hypothetical protein
VRRVIYSLVAGMGALLMGGCGSGRSTAAPPQSTTGGSAHTSNVALVGRPQEAVLRLSRGHSTARFVITGVPRDTWDLRIGAPAGADFEVDAQNANGEWLHLLETTHQREACAITGARLRCFQRFAIGTNQKPGRWTIIATKRTGPAATTRIQITFHRPGSE